MGHQQLQADLTKRFSSGLLFRANYSLSKNLDDGSGIASSQSQNQNQPVMDPRYPLRDYGRSALDFRHRASGNFHYEFPFGQRKPQRQPKFSWTGANRERGPMV